MKREKMKLMVMMVTLLLLQCNDQPELARRVSVVPVLSICDALEHAARSLPHKHAKNPGAHAARQLGLASRAWLTSLTCERAFLVGEILRGVLPCDPLQHLPAACPRWTDCVLVRRQHALPWTSGSSRLSHILRQDAAGMAVRQRASRPTQPGQPRRPRRRPRSQCKSIPSRTTARQRQLRPGYSDPLHYPQALDLVFAGRASRPQHAAALLHCCRLPSSALVPLR